MFLNVYFISALIMCLFFSRTYNEIKEKFATNQQAQVGLEFTAFIMTLCPVANTLSVLGLILSGVAKAILKNKRKKKK